MSATVRILAGERDGKPRWVETDVLYEEGGLAVTEAFYSEDERGEDFNGYVITHVASGRAFHGHFMDKRHAVAALKRCLPLADWPSVCHGKTGDLGSLVSVIVDEEMDREVGREPRVGAA